MIAIKRAVVLATIFISINISAGIAETTNIKFKDFQQGFDDSAALLIGQKVAKHLLFNDAFFAQNVLIAFPEIPLKSIYSVNENSFQLDVTEASPNFKMQMHTPVEEIIYLKFYKPPSLPLNKNPLGWNDSLNDTSYASIRLFSAELPKPAAEANVRGFYGMAYIAEFDNLYLPARKSSSLLLVGLGLLSFGCLRFKVRRLELETVKA